MANRLVASAAIVAVSLSGCVTERVAQRDAAPPGAAVTIESRPGPTLSSGDFQSRFIEVARLCAASVVSIRATSEVGEEDLPNPFSGSPFERFFFHGVPRPEGKLRQMGVGSGVIVDARGYILTNSHVVANAQELDVELSDDRTLDAKVVGSDERSDLAVIKVDAKDLTPMSFGASENLRVGEWVMAIGSPFGLRQTVSAGIVSAVGRGNVGIADYEDFIQTDAAINPGNSGGPLVNLEGKLVGINTAIASRNGGNQGVGFAIPFHMAHSVMDQLIDHGSVVRGYLGVYISDLTPELAESFDFEGKQGVLVQDVGPNTPGAKAGLKPGDIVVERDGKRTGDAAGFRGRIAQTAPGTLVKLGVFRDGKRIDLDVKLGELPSEPGAVLAGRDGGGPGAGGKARLGLQLSDLGDELRQRLGLGPDTKGALVVQVLPDSPAARGGLAPGDVIEQVGSQQVSSAAQAGALLGKADPKAPLRLRVVREGRGLFLVVPPLKGPPAD
jgi:serine protease Do